MNPAKQCAISAIFLIGVYLVTMLSAPFWLSASTLCASLSMALISLYLTSAHKTGRIRRRQSVLFIGLSWALTFITLFFISAEFHGTTFALIIGKLLTLIMLPITYQMYYKAILCFQYLFFKEPKVKQLNIKDDNELPSCSIIIATRNEPFDVCKLTFDSAEDLIYPNNKKEIIIVDNSDLSHPDLESWKNYVESYNNKNPNTIYKFIHRNGTKGFKPMNLDIAMKHVTKDYVLLLDADSTMHKETLLKTMPSFVKDPKLGFASLLIKGTNANSSFCAKIGTISQNMLRYSMSLIGQNGFVIFQGHNSIWSKVTLNKIGPWLEEFRGEPMIVEDVAAAVRCYFKGFYGKTIWVDSGEWVPTSLSETESMWMRWTYGGIQIADKYFKEIIKAKLMTFKEKTDVFNQMFSFSNVLTPIFSLLCVLFPQGSWFALAYVALLQIPSLLFMFGYGIRNKPKETNWLSWFGQLYLAFFVINTFIVWVSAKATMNYFMRKSQGWKPTGKTAEAKVSWKSVIKNNFGLLLFSITGIAGFTFTVLSWDYLHLAELCFMIPGLLFFINLFLSVAIFGRSRMTETDNIFEMQISNNLTSKLQQSQNY